MNRHCRDARGARRSGRTEGVPVVLPIPVLLDGRAHRTARLRPITGEDELFLLEEGASLLPAQRVTALLARCVLGIGSTRHDGIRLMRSLVHGNRCALLLHLRRLTLGSRLQCVLTCPQPECGKRMDLDLSIEDLLAPAGEPLPEVHERTVTEPDASYRVWFRLPTGADQEEAARMALQDPDAAEEWVLRQCVQEIEIAGGGREPQTALAPAVQAALPQMIAELDAQGEIRLSLTCPECGVEFETSFDPAGYLFKELAGTPTAFYRDVHALALHYHWSEAEIRSLTRPKRRMYIEMIADSLSRSME